MTNVQLRGMLSGKKGISKFRKEQLVKLVIATIGIDSEEVKDDKSKVIGKDDTDSGKDNVIVLHRSSGKGDMGDSD